MDAVNDTARSGRTLAGAVLLAGVTTSATLPFAGILTGRGLTLAVALVLLYLAWLPPAYFLARLLDRDARRVLDAGAARRQRLELLEERLAQQPLPFRVDDQEFGGIVEAELAALPPWVERELGRLRVGVFVEDQRDGDPTTLGLYERRPLAGSTWGGVTVDQEARITLFRLPLVRLARVPGRLGDVVRETLLHEIGHAFGMSEHDLDHYSIGNDPLPGARLVQPRRPIGDG